VLGLQEQDMSRDWFTSFSLCEGPGIFSSTDFYQRHVSGQLRVEVADSKKAGGVRAAAMGA